MMMNRYLLVRVTKKVNQNQAEQNALLLLNEWHLCGPLMP